MGKFFCIQDAPKNNTHERKLIKNRGDDLTTRHFLLCDLGRENFQVLDCLTHILLNGEFVVHCVLREVSVIYGRVVSEPMFLFGIILSKIVLYMHTICDWY